jgi:hypothetical protein
MGPLDKRIAYKNRPKDMASKKGGDFGDQFIAIRRHQTLIISCGSTDQSNIYNF